MNHYSLLDIVLVLPFIPLFPFAITWWLPWERWLPIGRIPLAVLGPYLLYGSLAAWHFKFHTWLVALLAISGAGVSYLALYQWLRGRRFAQTTKFSRSNQRLERPVTPKSDAP